MLDAVVQPADEKAIPRDKAEVDDSRAALVKKLLEEVEKDKQHHSKAMKRIEADLDFAYKWGIGAQWAQQAEDDERYIANIVQRHVTVRQSALYARDPTIVAKQARRREFKLWDGDMSSLQQAMMVSQQAMMVGQPPPPDVTEMLMDAQEGLLRQQMIRNLGDTLEIVYSYFMREQVPDFKEEIKQAVLRTLVCGASWVKIGYQRLYGARPEKASRLADVVDQMQTLDRLRADVIDETTDQFGPEVEQLRLMMQELQAEPEVIVREGLVWDFPQTTRVIVDRACVNLRSLKGAKRVTEWMTMSNDEVKEVYRVDVKAATKDIESSGRTNPVAGKPVGENDPLQIYHVYDRSTGLKYCVCEGYPDFLVEPTSPDVKVERFFPFYALVFNRIEHPKEVYPASDVRLLRSMQVEYNRKKEGEASHRRANRPLYAVASGALEDEDIKNGQKPSLSRYRDNEILVLNGLNDGEKIGDKLQAVPKVPVDPNLYESEGTFADMQRVVGSQEANFGGTSKSTATESSIAENTRLSSLDSNVDDLDDVLSALARDGGKILLMELSADSAIEICGPGAVWPEFSRADILKEVYLEIEAGSSGRPNQGRDIQNFKEMGPLMMQIPGQDPEKLAKYGWKILNPKLDPNAMLAPGMPSIQALNGMMQPPTGDPATDPSMQGAEGANKGERPREAEAGGGAEGPTIQYDANGQRAA